MIQRILSNQRFLTIPSDNLGRDWFEKTQRLDQQLEPLGLELAEEVVYLMFDRSPGGILAEEGRCLISRSVIGPKRNMTLPFGQHDWIQSHVWSKLVDLNDWGNLLKDCYGVWEELQRSNKNISPAFMITIKRTLNPKLVVVGEILFYRS